MGLKDHLQQDLKEALRNRDERRKAVIRMALAAIQLAEADHGGELDEPSLIAVLQKEVKRRQETIEELRGTSRADRLADEEAELAILESYLPRMLSREEIAAEARAVIAQVGATGPRDMGAVMQALMPRMKGRADGRLVNEVVRELLTG
ncbi:MAG: GatB/YqeY domain-containing protein [Anaerolineae bacterium]|nr:GatB/YqeY domain-containing protein [Anaerolineae bacterium]